MILSLLETQYVMKSKATIFVKIYKDLYTLEHLNKRREVGICLDIKICNRCKLYCHYHKRYLIVLEKNVAQSELTIQRSFHDCLPLDFYKDTAIAKERRLDRWKKIVHYILKDHNI